MYCKYCKKKDHNIDDCPDIICRVCKLFGHPHWKCDKKQENKLVSTNISNNISHNISHNNSNNNKKEVKKRSEIIYNCNDINDLNDFKKFLNISWGNI